MPESLKDFLVAESIGPEAIQEATRAIVGTMTNDLPADAMRSQLTSAAGDALGKAESALAHDPVVLTNACLEILEVAWEQGSDVVRAALRSASRKMPVIEVALITIAVMYGMYLLATHGVKKRRAKATYKPDGSYTEELTEEYYPPALRAVVDLVSAGLKSDRADDLEEGNKPPRIQS